MRKRHSRLYEGCEGLLQTLSCNKSMMMEQFVTTHLLLACCRCSLTEHVMGCSSVVISWLINLGSRRRVRESDRYQIFHIAIIRFPLHRIELIRFRFQHTSFSPSRVSHSKQHSGLHCRPFVILSAMCERRERIYAVKNVCNKIFYFTMMWQPTTVHAEMLPFCEYMWTAWALCCYCQASLSRRKYWQEIVT